MELGTLQRNLKNLLKGNDTLVPRGTDVYLDQVANAPGLEILREIALWWRTFQIEQFCIFTAAYLRLQGCFDGHVQLFYADTNVSSFIEEAGLSFLRFMACDKDPTIAALANFEYALIQAKKGDQKETTVVWPCNPLALLQDILNQQNLPAEQGYRRYLTHISPKIPHLFEVVVVDSNEF